MGDFIQQANEFVKTRFEQSKRVLSFEDYLGLVEQDPYPFLRNSAHYLYDCLDFFGQKEVPVRNTTQQRFKIFDQEYSQSKRPIIGQLQAQNQLFQILTGFVRTGKTDKLVVLHGPNGSAKSSLIRTLFEGLEHFSHQDTGAVFTFSWIFPHDSLVRGSVGLGVNRDSAENTTDSYTKLDQSKIGSLVRSELHENPIYLIPKELREKLFEEWKAKTKDPLKKKRLESLKDSFLKTDLSHKSSLIFEALLNEYQGDYKKVLRHVRVERYFMSRRFRKGLVTVEAQFGVDAHIRQVTLDRSMANLPPALQSLSLFQLEGDLIDGNRGIVEYDDILKRPVEHFKYLLGTCEKATVNLANVVAFLDTLFLASTNDIQLETFREHPEFNSFKARLEFIRCGYLLRYSEEEQIYLDDAQKVRGEKELLPHTTKVLALWAVLTRLKPPVTKNKSSVLTKVLESLSPLAKAKLYDHAELPPKLSEETRTELKNHIEDLVAEHQSQPYYEGMFGASARELKVLLQMASQNDQFATLGPNALFHELRKLVKNVRDFEYLRQESAQGYFDFSAMIQTVREEWLNWVDLEIKSVLKLENMEQFSDFLNRYINQVTSYVQKLKVKNKMSGKMEAADTHVLTEFEEYINISGSVDDFRGQIVSRIAAWAIENPQHNMAAGLPYMKIFPDLIEKMKTRNYEHQHTKLKAMGAFILDISAFDVALSAKNVAELSEPQQLAIHAYKGLQEQFGYGPLGAKEVLAELIKERYV